MLFIVICDSRRREIRVDKIIFLIFFFFTHIQISAKISREIGFEDDH